MKKINCIKIDEKDLRNFMAAICPALYNNALPRCKMELNKYYKFEMTFSMDGNGNIIWQDESLSKIPEFE